MNLGFSTILGVKKIYSNSVRKGKNLLHRYVWSKYSKLQFSVEYLVNISFLVPKTISLLLQNVSRFTISSEEKIYSSLN